MANVGAAAVPADDLVGLGDGSGAKERGKRKRKWGRGREGRQMKRERGRRTLGGKEDWERLGREGGKNRKDKNEEMPTWDYKIWHIQ